MIEAETPDDKMKLIAKVQTAILDEIKAYYNDDGGRLDRLTEQTKKL